MEVPQKCDLGNNEVNSKQLQLVVDEELKNQQRLGGFNDGNPFGYGGIISPYRSRVDFYWFLMQAQFGFDLQ